MEAAMSRSHTGGERLITIAEYEQMPEEDLYRVDLVRGMLVRSPIPAPLHGVLQIRIGRKLDEFVEHAGGGVVTGEVGAVLARDPDTVRGPDVAFYSTARIPESGYSGGFWGPPDLAVEILSPSNRASEVRAKIADYLVGVPASAGGVLRTIEPPIAASFRSIGRRCRRAPAYRDYPAAGVGGNLTSPTCAVWYTSSRSATSFRFRRSPAS